MLGRRMKELCQNNHHLGYIKIPYYGYIFALFLALAIFSPFLVTLVWKIDGANPRGLLSTFPLSLF